MARLFIIIGIALVLIGLCWPLIVKLGLGKLPGDIAIESEHSKFYFPIVSCLIVSAVISFVFWLLQK